MNKVDGVINFAAESHVDNSILNLNFTKQILTGFFLLEVCLSNWFDDNYKIKNKYLNSRFHQISTDEIYGSIDSDSFTETDKYKPNSPYAASKASADMIVRSYNKTYGLNTAISVSSNNFGFNQHHEKFIPKVINCLINGLEIPVYGNGSNVRDWIFVDDNCRAIDLIFNKGRNGESYNVGGGNIYTNLEVIDMIHKIICETSKSEKTINFIKDRLGHDKRYSLNNSKIISELGWKISKDKFIQT